MDVLSVIDTIDSEQEVTTEQYESLLDFLDPLSIGLRLGSTTERQDHYGAVVHGQLLRLKMLGLSDVNCAKAAGIHPRTLAVWQERYPMLVADMDRAAQLAVVGAAKRLFDLMSDDGPVALNAVKFFLGTHAQEFREKAELHIRTESDVDELTKAIRDVYGVEVPGPDDSNSVVAASELSAPAD